jgi:SAM-dependent methyltransferase
MMPNRSSLSARAPCAAGARSGEAAATRPQAPTVPSIPGSANENDPQAARNADVWRHGRFVSHYASRELRPAEVIFLVRYRELLEGRVLELGCGAGRLTGYLLEIAESVHGIDISKRMIDHCREAYPRGNFSVEDLRDIGALTDRPFDAVLGTYNVLGILGDAERRRVLGEIREQLVPGGLMMISAHNLAFVSKLRSPTDLRARNIVRRAGRLALMPLRLRNRRGLLELQSSGPGYAIVNDDAHDYRLLHYYISRDAQEQQLRELGFEFVECLDNEGHVVAPGESAADWVELYYVARRPHGAP